MTIDVLECLLLEIVLDCFQTLLAHKILKPWSINFEFHCNTYKVGFTDSELIFFSVLQRPIHYI